MTVNDFERARKTLLSLFSFRRTKDRIAGLKAVMYTEISKVYFSSLVYSAERELSAYRSQKLTADFGF